MVGRELSEEIRSHKVSSQIVSAWIACCSWLEVLPLHICNIYVALRLEVSRVSQRVLFQLLSHEALNEFEIQSLNTRNAHQCFLSVGIGSLSLKLQMSVD